MGENCVFFGVQDWNMAKDFVGSHVFLLQKENLTSIVGEHPSELLIGSSILSSFQTVTNAIAFFLGTCFFFFFGSLCLGIHSFQLAILRISPLVMGGYPFLGSSGPLRSQVPSVNLESPGRSKVTLQETLGI